MYEVIASHPTVREIWARQLEVEGLVTRDEVDDMIAKVRARLQESRAATAQTEHEKTQQAVAETGGAAQGTEKLVPESRLAAINEALLVRPESFTANAKLDGILQRRRTNFNKENGIDWGHAEALAFGSMLEDGTPIRLSGQDSERGTFGHRNLVLHDPTTGERFCPMQSLPQSKASFAVYNSPLSEGAVLGFEYGYSMHATDALVLWEAQFGDFVNSAQVIVDQFIASGNAKWQQTPSLVLLLPHGYEGEGPEHSSARIERFLQLCADDNIRVVNCSTSGQYYHVLRRQAALMGSKPRPLIVITPKSLLRLPEASSSLEELTKESFRPVIDDASARERAEQITRVVLCSGKIYHDLVKTEAYATTRGAAVVRVEELYPFPYRELQAVFSGYPELREIIWLQEEPHNMGAWGFVNSQIRQKLGDEYELRYVGRPASASPAVGSKSVHRAEQANILAAALSSVPEPKTERSKVANVR
jgi:2-oxoglutarate dehydrogenase E1 component